jgi:NADH:ubiquinone reductase (H+-translocating)
MAGKKLVVIGGGFGGLTLLKNINNNNLEILLIDKTNYHLFQPLLYQVATAALSPADIAVPIRAVLSNKKNVKVILDEAISVDRENQKVKLINSEVEYDYLVISTGTKHSYFGKDEWEKNAPGLKTLNDALVIREKIIASLEQAEKENDPTKKQRYLTFVVVGGGPTGVELAGAIAEIAKKTIIKDYRNFLPEETKVILVEAFPRILNTYDSSLSIKAEESLKKMGVEVKTNSKVEDISEDYVKLNNSKIYTKNIIWAAGNLASPLIKTLKIETDRAGRAIVEKDCSIPGYENIFVIGDACSLNDEKGSLLPGVAQVAMQQGKLVANIISKNIPKSKRENFHYVDKGSLATIGKAKAVAEIKGFKFSGLFAWLLWSFIHIFFLISFKNRFRVMIEWIWYYITNKRGTRLLVGK